MSLAIHSITNNNKNSCNIPDLLILHGFMGAAEDWRFSLPALTPHFNCHLIDLPGHGRSLTSPFDGHGHFITLFEKILQKFKRPLYILGYSMGGRVALELILTYPQYFKKAVIESAAPGIEDYVKRSHRLRADLELFTGINGAEDLNLFLKKWYSQNIFGEINKHPQFNSLLNKGFSQVKNWQKSLALLSVGAQPNLWPRLEHLSIPLLYVSGEKDKKYSKMSQKMQAYKMVSTIGLPNIGHNTHFENPQEFLARTIAFLRPCSHDKVQSGP